MKYKYLFTHGSIDLARYSTCTLFLLLNNMNRQLQSHNDKYFEENLPEMNSTEYVCWAGHEEIGYYKHCQWILAGGHLTMKIYLAYPGQPLVMVLTIVCGPADTTQPRPTSGFMAQSAAPHHIICLHMMSTKINVLNINMENDLSHQRIY